MSVSIEATPAVSVLVPIYNAEAYLEQCLEGLCGQTLKEIEIIGINDGSTDRSLAILQKYAARDARIKIIDKSNSGYGASMNRGLDIARGVYVGIVESDDFPSPDMFERLYRTGAKDNGDLVKSNYFEHYNDADRKVKNLKGYSCGRVFDPIEKPQIICTIPSIWTGLYKREMLESNKIRFRETPGAAFQDTAFVLKAWFVTRRCVLVRKAFLHYRIDNPSSSVKTTDRAFIVCDELAESERFLRALPDRAEAFLPWFHVDKVGKYRWNYERIVDSEKTAFAQRMHDELLEAQKQGELHCDLFASSIWNAISCLLDEGAETFVKKYPERF